MANKQLDYIINLVDKVSKPLQGITNQVNKLTSQGKQATEQIAYGFAGLVGTGAALKGALSPAIEFQNAMSNVKATGMAAEGLKKVEKFALDFSSKFGVAASEVVDSANEIVRAIDGLTDEEVIAFTKSSNVLAKATGASVQEMGSYLGTMYGIFQQEADKMGKAKWVEQMSAQATLTANMFKSSGESLSQAFTNLMSTGQAKGVALAEQFAVLGNLQSVMPGGMSGTKYAAFLKGVGKAQKKLGLSFLDAQKRMRTMPEILTEIRKKYGDVIDEVEALELSKAFGSDDAVAVLSYLLPKTESLKENIEKIGSQTNLDDALAISSVVTDVWARFDQILNNIRISIGSRVLEALNPFLNKIADAGTYFVKWLDANKYIAKYLGFLIGGMIALTAVIPAMMMFVGIFKMWKVGILATLLPFQAVGGVLGTMINILKMLISPALNFTTTLKGIFFAFLSLKKVSLGTALLTPFLAILKVLKLVIGSVLGLINPFKFVFLFLRVGFIGLFSPISLFVGLIAGIILIVYKFREGFATFFKNVIAGFQSVGISIEPIKTAFSTVWGIITNIISRISQMLGVSSEVSINFESWAAAGQLVGKILGEAVQFVIDVIGFLIVRVVDFADLFIGVILDAVDMWKNFADKISNGDILGAFEAIGEGIINIFRNAFTKLYNIFIKAINFIIEKSNQFLGTKFEPIKLEVIVEEPQLPEVTSKAVTVATNAVNPTQSANAPQPVSSLANTLGGIANIGIDLNNSALTVNSAIEQQGQKLNAEIANQGIQQISAINSNALSVNNAINVQGQAVGSSLVSLATQQSAAVTQSGANAVSAIGTATVQTVGAIQQLKYSQPPVMFGSIPQPTQYQPQAGKTFSSIANNTNTRNISQTFNINGASDPNQVARQVARQMQEKEAMR